jgi:hypothetical protein
MKKPEIHDLLRYFHNAKKKDGTLFPILGEDALALTASLAYLLEDTNVCIKAYSGTGKTVIMEAISMLLPDDYLYIIEHLSDTAIWYDEEAINKARFVCIPEAQKIPEGVMEIIKTWADGRTAQRKRTDVTSKYRPTIYQHLDAKYVLMAVAVENDKGSAMLDAELERRCMIMHTNPTVKQTEMVIKHKLMHSALPRTTLSSMSDEEVDVLRSHLIEAIRERDEDDATVIKNPCAPFLFHAIPSAFPVSRSKVQYLLQLINAIARFYPHEIIRTTHDGITYGLVSPKHNWLGLRIYLNSFVEECLHMPSHGTDILKLFPETRLDRFGFADSETVKMSEGEMKKAAKAAGLPFTKLRPVISGLLVTGFLELDDDGKRKLYYKSPLINEPIAKINWSDLIEETKNFVQENWPTVADEYIGRCCSSVKIIDPFNGNNLELGERAKTAIDVAEGDYPDVFKSSKDAKIRDYETFLIKAEGDYNEKEDNAVRTYYQKS